MILPLDKRVIGMIAAKLDSLQTDGVYVFHRFFVIPSKRRIHRFYQICGFVLMAQAIKICGAKKRKHDF